VIVASVDRTPLRVGFVASESDNAAGRSMFSGNLAVPDT
jgi:hypothetical protein